MDNKESELRGMLTDINNSLLDSQKELSNIKKQLLSEEGRTIYLRLSKDNIEEQLRRYLISHPGSEELEEKSKKIDYEFSLRVAELLKKV